MPTMPPVLSPLFRPLCAKGPDGVARWTKPLFRWDERDDSPDLKTIKVFLQLLPDGRLLEALRSARGRGRNDYPPHVLREAD